MSDKYAKFRNELAVLWEPFDPVDPTHPENPETTPFQERKFEPGVQITCRWVEGRQEYVDGDGRKQVADHAVMVGLDIPIGSYLRRGALSEVNPDDDPREYPGAHRVVAFNSAYNVAGTDKVRAVMLK